MFPVYIKKPKTNAPDADVYYIVAKNGLFLRKKQDWIDVVVPIKQIAILDEQQVAMKLLLPPPDSIVIAKTVQLFRAIYRKQRSEAAVLLHYSKELGWELSVPSQTVDAASVEYDMKERLPGYACVGTIHSHGSMGAFHSGIDQHDEAELDGVHITIGDVDEEACFSMDAEVVVNGFRFKLNPQQWLKDIQEVEEKDKPRCFGWWNRDRKYYRICCSELDGWKVPAVWFKKIKRSTYKWSSGSDEIIRVVDIEEPKKKTVSKRKRPQKKTSIPAKLIEGSLRSLESLLQKD